MKNLMNDVLQRLDQLESRLENCCATDNNSRKSAVEITNAIVLDQNTPNPFAESTTISYDIPVSFSDAKIIILDGQGSVLKVFKINDSGKGELTVYSENLSNGVYSYSLLVDGKVIDTKKMVRSK